MPLSFLKEGVRSSFERVWDTFVALPRDSVPLVRMPYSLRGQHYPTWSDSNEGDCGVRESSGRALESPPVLQSDWYGSVAWIGGSWTGNVRVVMEPELAQFFTARLLHTTSPDEEQIEDAMRELANMIAGNLKSSLPGIAGLATPGNFKVRSWADLRDEFPCVTSLWYRSRGRWILVSLSGLEDDVTPVNQL